MSIIWKPVKQWDGEDVYCIGGGPSLTDFDWSLLEGLNTIGCNCAYKLGYDICKICIFSDLSWWDKNVTDLAEFPGIVVCQTPALKNRGVSWLHWMERETKGLHKESLGFGGSTGASAINLALILGAKRVFLLGYDCKTKEEHGKIKTNWHDYYGNHTPKPKVHEKFLGGFESIARAHEAGVFPGTEIINLGPDSELEVFPKDDFNNYLPKRWPVQMQLISKAS